MKIGLKNSSSFVLKETQLAHIRPYPRSLGGLGAVDEEPDASLGSSGAVVEIEEEEAWDCLALRARIRLLNSRLVQRADSKRFFIASMNELQHSPVLSTANTNLFGSTRLLLFEVSSSSSGSSPPSNSLSLPSALAASSSSQ